MNGLREEIRREGVAADGVEHAWGISGSPDLPSGEGREGEVYKYNDAQIP